MPALVEADDLGMYVVKLRGAAQGAKALVAELVVGELARAVGLRVPELVLVEIDPAFGASERDPELAEPLERSVGLNVALDYLPGSVTYDPAARQSRVDPALAARIVLFDAFVANVDRTPRNPNLLRWHRDVWLIDHGAALYFHHGWSAASTLADVSDPFADVRHHVLLPLATQLEEAGDALASAIAKVALDRIASEIPDGWLGDGFSDAAAERDAYVAWLTSRVSTIPALVEEAVRAQRL